MIAVDTETVALRSNRSTDHRITGSPDLLRSFPAQAEVFALEVQQQRFLAVSGEVAGNAGVAVVGIVGCVHADANGMGAGAHRKRKRDGAPVDRSRIVEPRMRIHRAP